jgi:hypothetical protein
MQAGAKILDEFNRLSMVVNFSKLRHRSVMMDGLIVFRTEEPSQHERLE